MRTVDQARPIGPKLLTAHSVASKSRFEFELLFVFAIPILRLIGKECTNAPLQLEGIQPPIVQFLGSLSITAGRDLAAKDFQIQ